MDNITIGILKGNNSSDVDKYVESCKELNVNYEIIDIFTDDWIDRVKLSNADAFVVRPEVYVSVDKQLYDEKLYFIEKHMSKEIFPNFNDLYIYENKRNMAYWLETYNIRHPKTHIFSLNKKNVFKVEQFLEKTDYPIVFKTYIGSAAAGVEIVKNKRAALKLVNRVRKKGYVRKPGNKRDVQWRYIIFQQYIEEASEWRMIKIGDNYFGHKKLQVGEFHSGSGEVGWVDPPKRLLDFCKNVCELGNFQSMALDIFESKDGKYYVNELQAIFGSYLDYQMRVDDTPGRYREVDGEWVFEEGEFNRNSSNNLRIEYLINKLSSKEG